MRRMLLAVLATGALGSGCSDSDEEAARIQAQMQEQNERMRAEFAQRQTELAARQRAAQPPAAPVPQPAVPTPQPAIAAAGAHTPVEIPADERGGGDTPWLAYAGQGFRYQVPPGFTATAHPEAGQAWAGTRQAIMGGAVPITLWAMRRPFAGDLAAYENEQRTAVEGRGGRFSSMEAVIFGVMHPAKNLTVTDGTRRRMVRAAVRDGHVYTYACEAESAQFLGIMSDCAILVSTLRFHP